MTMAGMREVGSVRVCGQAAQGVCFKKHEVRLPAAPRVGRAGLPGRQVRPWQPCRSVRCAAGGWGWVQQSDSF